MTDGGEEPAKPKRKKRKGKGKKPVRNRSDTNSPRNNTTRARATLEGSKPTNPMDVFREDAEQALRKAELLEVMVERAVSAIGAGARMEPKVHRTTVWRWRRNDAEFNEACEQAYKDGTETLKDRASDLAMTCEAKDAKQLLDLTIKGRDASWRDPKYLQPNQGPRSVGTASIDLDDLTAEERDVLRKIAERQAAKAERKAVEDIRRNMQ
jgi:hypothetical protein